MALQSSGAISFNNINVELGVAGTTSASLNQSSYRTLAGVASGAISMSNFYGKSNSGGSATRTISYNYSPPNREGLYEASNAVMGTESGTSPNVIINGAILYQLYSQYNYDYSNYYIYVALVGVHSYNKFSTISGNGRTYNVNDRVGFVVDPTMYSYNGVTTWFFSNDYTGGILGFPINRTSGSMSATITWT